MSIRKSFLRGLAFIAVTKYSGILVNLLVTSILARLLSPADFGVVAISTVFIMFFSLLGDMGIGPAIIQFKQLSHDDFCSIFGVSFWMALVLASLFFAFSPLIANFYDQNILTDICRWLSLQIFFTTLNIVPNSLLLREKKFDVIAYRNVGIQIFCGTLAVWAAYSGWSVYALLLSPILSAFMTLIINVYYMKLSIRLIPDPVPIKMIFSFSAYQFLFNFVNYFGRNLDKLIIGKTINVVQLGFYEKSYRLMQMPIANINGVLDPVLLPFLSESQNDLGRILLVYNRMTRILIHVSFPLAAMLFCSGKEIILLLFGEQWLPSVPCFTILTISVATQIPMCSTGGILQACNQTKLHFKLGNQNVCMVVIGLLIAVFRFGTIEAIAVAFDITSIMVVVNTFYTVYNKCFHTSPMVVFSMLCKPLLYCLVVVVVLKGLEFLIPTYFLFSFCIKGVLWMSLTFFFFQKFTQYRPLDYLKQFNKSI